MDAALVGSSPSFGCLAQDWINLARPDQRWLPSAAGLITSIALQLDRIRPGPPAQPLRLDRSACGRTHLRLAPNLDRVGFSYMPVPSQTDQAKGLLYVPPIENLPAGS